MPRPKKLNAAFVKTIAVPGRYGDGYGGRGLSFLVKPRAHGGVAKSWSQRLPINGKPTSVGLGAYPIITLAEARAKALENRRAIAHGKDIRGGGIPTFAQAVEKVIAIYEPTWKAGARSAEIWRSSLERYVYPKLANKRVDKITTADVLGVLIPFWNTRRETARRVRQRISAVMKWAVAQNYREDNPAGDAIAAALPKNGTPQVHQRALPHEEVGVALKTVRESNAWPITKLAFEFLTLAASRSGEVRLATWDEFNLRKAIWIVPADRMKAGREHRVPLSGRAIEILEEARSLFGESGLVFPSPTGRALSDNTISKLCRENNIGCVPHGMRSSFRDWAAECSDTPREVCELALAHVNSDRVEAAYRRTDLFERRRELMEAWADYIANSVTHG